MTYSTRVFVNNVDFGMSAENIAGDLEPDIEAKRDQVNVYIASRSTKVLHDPSQCCLWLILFPLFAFCEF